MVFEGLICPNCSGELEEKQISDGRLKCPHCKVNIRQKKYLAFLEYLMMNGLVNDIDFFDQKIYGHEIEQETVEQIAQRGFGSDPLQSFIVFPRQHFARTLPCSAGGRQCLNAVV